MRDRKLENYKKEDFDLQLKQLQFIQEISLKVSKFFSCSIFKSLWLHTLSGDTLSGESDEFFER